jgi:hypothetical protein
MNIKLTTEQQQELKEAMTKCWHGKIKMVDHCLKSSKYIYINGKFIDCCDSKPTIHKTMWYDDETAGPNVNYLNFEHYNMKYAPKNLSDKFEYYIQPQYSGDPTDKLYTTATLLPWEDPKDCFIPLTDNQKKNIDAAITEVREDYQKRLKTYWKKYSNKVYAMGYWANR